MRLSKFRPRFTLRWLMIVVAIVAIGLGVEAYRRHLVRLSDEYRRKVVMHRLDATMEDFDGERVETMIKLKEQYGSKQAASPSEKAEVSRHARAASRHRNLAEKYERASHYPWLPVAPDPPEPE